MSVRVVRPDEAHAIDVKVRAEILEAAEKQLNMAVARARGAGVSWERIGEAVGISRQAATERFGKLVDGGE
jgi:DNA-binding Lrp family transcriptional regulator